MEQHKGVESTFRQSLAETVARREYVRVHYYSELHELLKVTSVLKSLEESNGKSLLVLASGEEIPLSNLVRVGNMLAPGHDEDDFYSCDC